MDRWLSITEVSQELGRSRQLIDRWVRAKRIRSKLIAGRRLVRAKDCRLPEFRPAGRPRSS